MKRSKKPLPEVEIISYGQYTRWDRNSRELPELVELRSEIPADIDVEFGMVLEIRGAKGRYLTFRIDHPPFEDAGGNIAAPFEGTYQVKSSPFRFFLGDSIWAPADNKKGDWKLSVFFDGELVASKTLTLI